MIEWLKATLGFGPSVDYAQLVQQGAVILDVRSKAEYSGGHIKGSLNIPVDHLANHLQRLPNKGTPIITCCASGARSAVAGRLLSSKGYKSVYNGGSWTSLNRKLDNALKIV